MRECPVLCEDTSALYFYVDQVRGGGVPSLFSDVKLSRLMRKNCNCNLGEGPAYCGIGDFLSNNKETHIYLFLADI